MTLSSDIRQAEQSIAMRRGNLRVALDGVTHGVSKRMVSPPVLVTAGLLGAALHRDVRMHGLRMLALLETANAGLRLLRTLSDRTRAAATTR
jgi:hypothetical protein